MPRDERDYDEASVELPKYAELERLLTAPSQTPEATPDVVPDDQDKLDALLDDAASVPLPDASPTPTLSLDDVPKHRPAARTGLAEWLQERRMAVSSKTPATRSPRARTSGATSPKPARTRQRKPRVQISTEGLPIGGQPKPKPKPSPKPKAGASRRPRMSKAPTRRTTSTTRTTVHRPTANLDAPDPTAPPPTPIAETPRPKPKPRPVVARPSPEPTPRPVVERPSPEPSSVAPPPDQPPAEPPPDLAAATSRLEALPDLGQAAARLAALPGLDDLPPMAPAPTPRPVAAEANPPQGERYGWARPAPRVDSYDNGQHWGDGSYEYDDWGDSGYAYDGYDDGAWYPEGEPEEPWQPPSDGPIWGDDSKSDDEATQDDAPALDAQPVDIADALKEVKEGKSEGKGLFFDRSSGKIVVQERGKEDEEKSGDMVSATRMAKEGFFAEDR